MKKTLLRFLLVAVPVFAGMSLSAQNSCFQGWRYTQPVSVRNFIFGLLNDWQVKVTIDTQTLINAGKMNADGSDIRFTTSDCCTEIPYWIESGLNSPATIIWARVPQLASLDTTWIQMYYGNPNATTPVSDLDLVMFALGNDSMGTDSARPGVTVATQEYTFPINARTVLWRIYSADTMRVKFKVTNDTNMVTGSSAFYNVPSTPGFHFFNAALAARVGGHPGWYTSTGGSFLNSCAPVVPCPGSCGYSIYKPGDQGVFGALKTDTCGVFPSMKVWYRRGAFVDPGTTNWPEFDRNQGFILNSPGGNQMCPNDTLQLFAPSLAAQSHQWYHNGNLIVGATDTSYLATHDGLYHCVADFGMACHNLISDTIAISYPFTEVDLGPDRLVCTNGNDTIVAPSGFQGYLWSDNSTNSSLVVPASGSYWLQVTDSIGCTDADTIQITLHALPVPTINILGDSIFCPGESTSLSALNQNWFAYQWLPGEETSGNIVVSDSGTFQVIVWDSEFCSDTSAAVTISLFALPVVDLGPDVEFCIGDSVTFDAGTGWTSIMWPLGVQTQTYEVFTQGSFVVDVVDSNGCVDADTVNVQVNPLPVVDLGPSDSICANATVTLDAGAGLSTFAWSNGETTQTVTVGPGVYNVAVTDSNGCATTSNVIYFFAYPVLDPVTIAGDFSGLEATLAPNYQWYLDSVAIPGATASTFTPDVPGAYMVIVTDPYGCADIVSNVIIVEEIDQINAEDIPQGFSPNGDGINDFFYIANISSFPGNSLMVFNRWGSIVYERRPYDNTFNGVGDDGNDLADGTYFYILKLGNGQEFSDYLIINR
jgi:gliding motility-associated-like protein